jgi:hydrogenase maturation protein HypF
MLEHEINAPLTTSAGRLFDAVAALLGLYPRSSFEGQAAMALEFLAEESPSEEAYPLEIGGTPLEVDWRPLIAGILDDLGRGTDRRRIARRFHQTMVAAIAGVAHRAGLPRVILTGGCFQNKLLTEEAVIRLEAEGFTVYRHQRVPPNDGGIALGQVYAEILRGRAGTPAPAQNDATAC